SPPLQCGALDLKSDVSRIRARLDYKIVLKLPLVAVVNQVNAVINILVFDSGIRTDIGLPLSRIAAQKIVALSRQLVQPMKVGRRNRADEPKADVQGICFRGLQGQYSLVRKQKQRKSLAAR